MPRGNGHDRTARQQFKLVPFDAIEVGKTRNYLVKGLIPREGLVVVWGPPKCGKTFWVFDLSMHVALGWPYRDRKVQPGPVVYVACEGERGLAARVEAFRQEFVGELLDRPAFHLVTTRLDLVGQQGGLVGDIRSQIGDMAPVLVVIDTLNRSLAGSESSDEDMGAYVKAVDFVREQFGCTVLVIHHCGHESTRPRGHTSLAGAADAQIAVSRQADKSILARLEFMKDGPEGEEIRSELDPVELGADEDGDPISSCIIRPFAGVATAGGDSKLTAQNRRSLSLLHDAMENAGEIAPDGRIPPGVTAVKIELWREYCYRGQLADSDKADAKRQAFGRNFKQLQNVGAILYWEPWVWFPSPRAEA